MVLSRALPGIRQRWAGVPVLLEGGQPAAEPRRVGGLCGEALPAVAGEEGDSGVAAQLGIQRKLEVTRIRRTIFTGSG